MNSGARQPRDRALALRRIVGVRSPQPLTDPKRAELEFDDWWGEMWLTQPQTMRLLMYLFMHVYKRSGPGRPLKQSTEQLKELVASAVLSKRKAAKTIADRTGEKAETLRSRLRPKRYRRKGQKGDGGN